MSSYPESNQQRSQVNIYLEAATHGAPPERGTWRQFKSINMPLLRSEERFRFLQEPLEQIE